MSWASIGLAAVLAAHGLFAQSLPPELRQPASESRGYDPLLPASIRDAVARAVEAELDEKRGPGNGVEILRAELRKQKGDRDLEMSLNVRLAAIMVRARFASNDKVTKSEAYQQALSTYAKLDLTDPGLRQWIDRTLEMEPEGAKKLRATGRKITVAILTRGEGLVPAQIHARLFEAFKSVGIEIVKAPVKSADYVLKFGADQLREAGQAPRARVTLDLEHSRGQPWKRTLFRTTEAKNPEVASLAAIEWLVRIGGRDLLFHWLAENGLPKAVAVTPRAGPDHGGHPH